MSDSFIPEGGEPASKAERWVNPKGWPTVKGVKTLRWRFLSGLAQGWIGWSGGKPLRAPAENMFPAGTKWDEDEFKGEKVVNTPKFAWAAFGYCPDDSDPEVRAWEIPQATIRKALSALVEQWGDPRGFDIVATQNADKKGYTVQPHPSGKCPPNAVALERWNAALAAGADMKKLYAGEDPFPPAGAGNAPASAGDEDVPF